MDFQSAKSFGKLILRAFQPYHQYYICQYCRYKTRISNVLIPLGENFLLLIYSSLRSNTKLTHCQLCVLRENSSGAGCKWWDDAVSRDVLYLSRTPHMLLYQGGKSLSHHQHLARTLYVRKCTPLPADADIFTFTCLKSFCVNYIQIYAW